MQFTKEEKDMQDFVHALIHEGKNRALPEEFNYFKGLIGDWDIDYIDYDENLKIQGEWDFAWVLEGMAIQDVIVLPGYEVGTSLRFYNPNTHAWDVAYGFTGKIIRLEARKQENRIELTFIDDETRKWVFVKIEEACFHWQNITVQSDGEWHIHAEIFATRKKG